MIKIDNKELFKREYLCKWVTHSEGYNKAYELWIDFEYNCEKFDKNICHGNLDDHGFIKPASGYEERLISQNANYLRNKVLTKAKELKISSKDLQDSRKNIDRLTWKGIQEEYHRLSNMEEK